MGIKKRLYTEEGYFNFLYDLAFKKNNYILLAKELHAITYEWDLRMDENRVDDGYEIRKYYLADKNGYLPDGIDLDDDIFPRWPSVLEVLVGFSNKLCRDSLVGWKISDLFNIYLSNLWLDDMTDRKFDKKKCIYLINEWMDGGISMFGDESTKSTDLWSQAAEWMQEI